MIIVLNNKSNLEYQEFMEYQKKLEKLESNHQLVLCPTSIYFTSFHLKNFELGSQNVSSYQKGAYTGEIYAKQLKELGVKYSIVGHSERRKYQKETNKEIREKIKNLLEEEITPILCIGEDEKEKQENKTLPILIKDIEECLKDLDSEKCIIAYEPVWAIGSGILPTKEEIETIVKEIKKRYPKNKVIYGGSLDSNNIKQLKDIKLVVGYLLGGLSLKTEELGKFLKELNQE